MRRLLPVLLAISVTANVVLLVDYRTSAASGGDAAIHKGTVITIDRPTGEFVTAAHGAHPQPKMEKVQLVVFKRQGEAPLPSTQSVPWRITVGGITWIAEVAD